MRFVILGLYNSGSTALAGMMHRLGANMGPPFFATSDETSDLNYYEPLDLSNYLRWCWDEPNLVERAAAGLRTASLRLWVEHQERASSAPVGAKHPFLSLCGRELLAGWGPDTRLIWSYRDLDESIRGLERRRWHPGREAAIQLRLWNSLCEFERTQPGLVRVNWSDVKLDPAAVARNLAGLVGLQPSQAQLAAAAS